MAFGIKRETSRSSGFPSLVPVPSPSISSTDLGHPGKADNVGCFDATPGSLVLRGQNKVRDPVWSSGPKCRRCRCLLWGWTRSGAGGMRQGRRARRTRVAEVNLNLVDPPPPILVRSNYPLETRDMVGQGRSSFIPRTRDRTTTRIQSYLPFLSRSKQGASFASLATCSREPFGEMTVTADDDEAERVNQQGAKCASVFRLEQHRSATSLLLPEL